MTKSGNRATILDGKVFNPKTRKRATQAKGGEIAIDGRIIKAKPQARRDARKREEIGPYIESALIESSSLPRAGAEHGRPAE